MTRTTAYDIAVIGAGPAGVAAAIAGAAGGASVLLVDAWDRLGGSVTAGLHRCLCGLYADTVTDPRQTLNAGWQRTVVTRMFQMAPESVHPRQLGKTCVLEFPTEVWMKTLTELCAQARIEVRLNTRLTALQRSAAHLTGIALQGADPATIAVRALIDCTGEGRLLQLAGDEAVLPADPTETPVLAGYAVRLAGLTGDVEALRLAVPYTLSQAVAAGVLPPAARFSLFYPGPGPAEGICKLAVPPEVLLPSQLERYVHNTLAYLTSHVPGLGSARIVEKSPRALPRHGLHLRGRQIVTQDDVLQGRPRSPGAVHAWWPVELWDVSRGPVYAYPPVGKPYDIPDGALQSAAFDNLFAAGACLAATPPAAASLRAAGICLATGGAAGRLAAALCTP